MNKLKQIEHREKKLQELAERVLEEGCTRIQFMFKRKTPRHQDRFMGVDMTGQMYDIIGFKLDEETVYKIAELLIEQSNKQKTKIQNKL